MDVYDGGMTKIAFRDSLARALYSKTLNLFDAPRFIYPAVANPPQIHMPNNIFTITLFKNDLMKDVL